MVRKKLILVKLNLKSIVLYYKLHVKLQNSRYLFKWGKELFYNFMFWATS